jgi:phenylacetate-CoA ligase
LRVVPFEGIADVLDQLIPLRGYIQTAGLVAGRKEQEELADRFSDAGALRILELGCMAEGEIDDPHDGAQDLPQFMRLVLRRLPGRQGWTPAETLTQARRRELIDARLRRIIDVAHRSPFYGRRLKGVSIETVADLANVPELTRDEMEANMPPQGEGLRTSPWTGGYVSRSGGSTGAPKFSVYDRHDWEAMIESGAEVFRGLGLRPADRLGNFMLAGDLYGSFVSFDHVNHRLGLATFGFAGNSKPETFVDVWRKFHINAVEGIPTHTVPFLRAAKKLEPKLSLEKLVYAGSPMSSADYDWLKSGLKVQRISSVIGANDGGQMGYQCELMRGPMHHAIDEFNWIEVVDEKGRPVRDGEIGRILITSLLKFAYPLIRYAIGDAGRIVKGTCPCGRPARRFELLGRCDDTLAIGNMKVRHRDFISALRGLPVSALQIAALSDEDGETLAVRVETPSISLELEKRVRRALLANTEKLKERLGDGSLRELALSLHKPGQLPRNPRTGKLKSPVDERL